MIFLLRLLLPLFITVYVAMLSGCSQPSTLDYDNLKRRPRSEWAAFAGTLPTQDRLDLYDEVYERSGHPPDTILARAFENENLATLDAVLSRTRTDADFVRYLPIMLAIGRSGSVDLCEDRNRSLILSKAEQVQLDRRLIASVDLGDCYLMSDATSGRHGM